jgi:hypothetical protein
VKPSDKIQDGLRDPAFMLQVDLCGWEETKNPTYIWEAIDRCERHGMPYPREVHQYLAEVAQRMCSAEARKATDLARVLPKLLGFHKGRGPGRLLDPDNVDADRMNLALLFATALEEQALRGARLNASAALRTALEKLPPSFQQTNDKTLKRWIEEATSLPHRARTAAEWRSDLRWHYNSILQLGEIIRETISRNKVM